MTAVGVVVLAVAGVPMSSGAAWSAPAVSPSSVTVTADPASGGEVGPGDSITYTLTAIAVMLATTAAQASGWPE